MFIVQIDYKAAISEIDKYLPAHREFLESHYRQGDLIASGPRNPRDGGIVIAAGHSREKIEAIFKNDPFYLADIASYQFIEFSPVKHCDALKELILNTEGKLC